MTTDLNAVWSGADGSAIAVGAGGVILRMRFDGWHQETSHATEELLDVAGSGPAFAVVVGRHGTLLQSDGASWERPQGQFCDTDIRAVEVASPMHAIAVGADGCLMHFDGQTWVIEASPLLDTFHYVHIGSIGHLPDFTYAIGYRSAIQREATGWAIASRSREELWGLHKPTIHQMGPGHYYLITGPELYEIDGEDAELLLRAEEMLNGVSGDEQDVLVVGSAGVSYRVRGR